MNLEEASPFTCYPELPAILAKNGPLHSGSEGAILAIDSEAALGMMIISYLIK
jgi:hypothetical protein